MDLSSCFYMVLETCSLGPNMMALEGHLLVASACWLNGLLALRDLPLMVKALLMVMEAGHQAGLSQQMAPWVSHPCPYWQRHTLHMPACVVVLEGCLFLFPDISWLSHPLCVGMVVMEGSFPDLAFLSRTMACKTINFSFSGISLFGRKWWSWKDSVEVKLL